jgi:peptidyl-dipeptidase A
MLTVEGFDLDGALKEKDAEWLARQGERFYVSMGFDALPQSFWDKSSLYPLPSDADHKKNNHASAWHMDLNRDVRSLMSIVPNADWYETVHHEYGHVYYFLAYSNDDVPPLLRNGANRAFHEAVGSLLGLAAMQKPFLEHLALLPAEAETDEMQTLLKEALNYIVFLPWSAGVMTDFEHRLYAENLPEDQFNQAWWELKKSWQGIVPPGERGEEYCDAASKTHINNDAAQYYDYALSFVILFQLHDHIAKNILQQDPHATNYFGSQAVGDFLKSILTPGASADWRTLMKDNLGEEISAKPMLRYFEPLMEYLKKENAGRNHTI